MALRLKSHFNNFKKLSQSEISSLNKEEYDYYNSLSGTWFKAKLIFLGSKKNEGILNHYYNILIPNPNPHKFYIVDAPNTFFKRNYFENEKLIEFRKTCKKNKIKKTFPPKGINIGYRINKLNSRLLNAEHILGVEKLLNATIKAFPRKYETHGDVFASKYKPQIYCNVLKLIFYNRNSYSFEKCIKVYLAYLKDLKNLDKLQETVNLYLLTLGYFLLQKPLQANINIKKFKTHIKKYNLYDSSELHMIKGIEKALLNKTFSKKTISVLIIISKDENQDKNKIQLNELEILNLRKWKNIYVNTIYSNDYDLKKLTIEAKKYEQIFFCGHGNYDEKGAFKLRTNNSNNQVIPLKIELLKTMISNTKKNTLIGILSCSFKYYRELIQNSKHSFKNVIIDEYSNYPNVEAFVKGYLLSLDKTKDIEESIVTGQASVYFRTSNPYNFHFFKNGKLV